MVKGRAARKAARKGSADARALNFGERVVETISDRRKMFDLLCASAKILDREHDAVDGASADSPGFGKMQLTALIEIRNA